MSSDTTEHLKNPLIVIALTIIGLWLLGLFSKEAWIYAFTTLSTFMIADIILNFLIEGEEGYAKIPILGHQFQNKGHSYLAYFIGVFLGTIISSMAADWILKTAELQFGWAITFAITSVIIALLTFANFEIRFYWK